MAKRDNPRLRNENNKRSGKNTRAQKQQAAARKEAPKRERRPRPEGERRPRPQEGERRPRPQDGERPARKLFRDPDGKKIGGVCSGIALFLNVDVVLIRVIFLIALICGSAGFWIYLIILIAAPEARTAAEKCELRGIPATAENIKRFTKGF